eukprot:2748598-Lingulodinium_polyedra.AAC.1
MLSALRPRTPGRLPLRGRTGAFVALLRRRAAVDSWPSRPGAMIRGRSRPRPMLPWIRAIQATIRNRSRSRPMLCRVHPCQLSLNCLAAPL